MSAIFPNGTQFSVSRALLAAALITSITNDKPGVATTTAPPAQDDVVVLTSAWPGLNERVTKAGAVTANSFEMLGIDTTSTRRFPTGQGAGSFLVVDDWVLLSQITTSEKAGGEQQFFQWQYIDDTHNRQRQRPTFKNAKSLTLTLDYDPALEWYDEMISMDAEQSPVVLRAVLPNGAELYYYVYPSFDGDPSMTINTNMQNTATFSMISDFTRVEA
ncbi:phage tail protein [Alcaligenaceae bacterium B3P038]|nr:phage tail protein [Alcaligenaceae bacterium B3P038]